MSVSVFTVRIDFTFLSLKVKIFSRHSRNREMIDQSPPLVCSAGGAHGVARGVRRRCLASAGSWGVGLALGRTRPSVFRTMFQLLQRQGRRDMLACIGPIARCRVWDFKSDGEDSVIGLVVGLLYSGTKRDTVERFTSRRLE